MDISIQKYNDVNYNSLFSILNITILLKVRCHTIQGVYKVYSYPLKNYEKYMSKGLFHLFK